MKYTLIGVRELETDGILSGILFTLKVKHPKFGSQLLKYEFNGTVGMTVQEWVDLPQSAKPGTLVSILAQARDSHWAGLEERAGNTSAPPPEYPDLIGVEI